MTIEELDQIKDDVESGLSYTDIAMNRGLNKASMIALLEFEKIFQAQYISSFEDELIEAKKEIEKSYIDEIESLKDEISSLKSNDIFFAEKELKEKLRLCVERRSFLESKVSDLSKELSRYKNSIFSCFIR